MNNQPIFNRHKVISYGLVGVLISLSIDSSIGTPPVQAQSLWDKIGQLISPNQGRGSASGRSRGGAIRGICKAMNRSKVEDLVALIPKDNVGKAIESAPTFWFYVPAYGVLSTETTSDTFSEPPSEPSSRGPKLTPVKMGAFGLLDENGQPVLKQLIPVKLPEENALVRVTLPEDKSLWLPGKSLQVGKRYKWFFSIVCSENELGKNPEVTGWIERVAAPANLNASLQKVPASDRYQVYVENGLWYESLTALAENRKTANDSWLAFLKPLGLEGISNEPIIELKLDLKPEPKPTLKPDSKPTLKPTLKPDSKPTIKPSSR